MLRAVRITHAQFDSDYTPDFSPIVNIMVEDYEDAVEVQHAVCQTLEFQHALPVDYVEWEFL